MVAMHPDFWRGKKVWVTGHTGFKGSWLSLWLLQLGAEVKGMSLEPNTNPALFNQLNLSAHLCHQVGDVRDRDIVRQSIDQWQPDIIFHLAAQPLVRRSYLEPAETWNTNVMGTINVLESLKQLTHPCAVVVITTDKCYENREWLYGYRETDPLGGHDPYSSSKAAAELAIASWRNSFFSGGEVPIGIASARAGNVIGGGDWAEDRIVPDAMRSLLNQKAIPVRNPRSTRPWQHVLEPLGGYLRLGQKLYEELSTDMRELRSAFNFGPSLSSNRTVRDLVECMLQSRSGSWIDKSNPNAVHEATLLNLVTDKAFHLLNWQPVWGFERTVQETVDWYHQASQFDFNDHDRFQSLSRKQIDLYQSDINKQVLNLINI
jgi:CDP-glucose 4,6-dehydratase